jgi:hypothetical protein
MKKATEGRARIAVAVLVIAAAVIGAGSAALVAGASTSGSRITVTEREYRLTLSRRTFAPGTVTFVVLNRGKLAHSLAIHGPGVSRRIIGTIPPGGRRTLVVHLSSGKYSLWCPVPGHARLGMKATLTAASGTSTGGTTTSGGGGGWG